MKEADVTLAEVGFLSPQISTWIQKHRSENRDWFGLCEELNRLAQTGMLDLEPRKTDEQQLLVVLLLSRVISHFQAIILLAERGMVVESRSLLRGMLDASFALVALAKHVELLKAFVHDDLHQRLKLVNSMMSLPRTIKKRHGTGTKKLQKLAADINAEIEKEGAKPLTSEYLAQKAGMTAHYNTLFILLSSSTHSRVRDMERHLELDAEKNIEGLMWGPDVKDVDSLLIPAIENLFICVRAANDLFDYRKADDGLEASWKRYNELMVVEEAKQKRGK
jgi:hypothetical protein